MSGSKDKRIKRLKRKRIWPSVLGLFFILVICSVSTIAIVASAFADVVSRKVSQGSRDATQIAGLYVGCDSENIDEINEKALDYAELRSEVEAVSVFDLQHELLWSDCGKYPKLDTDKQLDFYLNEEEIVTIFLEEGQEQSIKVEDGELVLDEEFFESIHLEKVFGEVSYLSEDEENSVFQMKMWFVVPVDELEICVLQRIDIYNYDLVMPLLTLVLVLFMLGVFAIYYIGSFISLIVSMHRTTKILYTDVITGGNNWLHFTKKGTGFLKWNRSGKRNYAMVHLKMRKYRTFCTCFGVREGEELIEKFYLALKKKIKWKEAMAHHENAEFGLLLMYTDEAQLTARIEEMEQAMCAVLPTMKMYFGIGVCQVEPGEKDVDQLYNNALIACDMSGEDNENKIAFFNIEMNKQRLWERKVEDDMERALINKEFKIYLQPKIDTSEETLAGAEALVRWIHPTEGFIPPNKFIPIFEQNGFILKLDDYMLEEVARQQADWIAQGRKIVPISVNVSRAHFTREDLAEHICHIVDKYQVPHHVIELELTESAFFDDKQVLLNTVKKLREFGFSVSMDDFGAGYSSLNSLKELQIDVLKIDADFFRGAEEVERGMLIVSEVIDLAKKLDMKIVAEGIESREQVDFLAEQECDLIQGYFFAKPMPIDEFVEKYKA